MKNSALLIIFIHFIVLTSFATKNRVITGRVSQLGGGIIAGASVSAKEIPSIYTLTDSKGNYRIEMPGEVNFLIFSYSGMETKEVKIKELNSINVVLIPANYKKIRFGAGFSIGGANFDVFNDINNSIDTSVTIKLTPFSLHLNLTYNFSKRFYAQTILEEDLNFMTFNDEETDEEKTGILSRSVFSATANYNLRFSKKGNYSAFIGAGPQLQYFSVIKSTTAGLRLHLGISLNNYGFNTKIYWAGDITSGNINGIEQVEGFKFDYASSRIGILLNF